MGSACRCLFRYCCESQGEDDDEHDNNNHSVDQQQQSYSSVSAYTNPIEGQGLISTSSRGIAVDEAIISTSETIPIPNADEDEDDNGNRVNNNCCRPNSGLNETSSLFDIIRRHMNRWQNNPYDSVALGDDPNSYIHHFSSTTAKKSVPTQQSPLRQALTFNTSTNSNIPCTINSDEIVLPGSIIQQQMAQQMKLCAKSVVQGTIDECVICMEPFDSTNPRMPTLCSCGVNKTYFHLPCLYQWIEQSEECPSCRTKITWEEF
jgi:hypothetical protein